MNISFFDNNDFLLIVVRYQPIEESQTTQIPFTPNHIQNPPTSYNKSSFQLQYKKNQSRWVRWLHHQSFHDYN